MCESQKGKNVLSEKTKVVWSLKAVIFYLCYTRET